MFSVPPQLQDLQRAALFSVAPPGPGPASRVPGQVTTLLTSQASDSQSVTLQGIDCIPGLHPLEARSFFPTSSDNQKTSLHVA